MITLTVPSIEQQNGHVRPHQKALRLSAQLENVTEFDYDINNQEFVEYCKRRGVASHMPVAALTGGNKVLYFYKAKLQDAWELFIGHVEDQPQHVVVDKKKIKEKLINTILTIDNT